MEKDVFRAQILKFKFRQIMMKIAIYKARVPVPIPIPIFEITCLTI